MILMLEHIPASLLRKHLHFEGLGRPALIIFLATIMGGGCNYFYQSFMGHSLSPEEYSLLSSLLSIFYIVGIPSTLFGTTIVRYVSKLKGEGKEGEIAWFIRRSFLISMVTGAVLFVVIFLSMPWLKVFLAITDENTILLIGIGAFLTMLGPPAVGGTQGLKRFYQYSIYNIFGPVGKLMMGILFVTLGMGVGGAFGGMVVGTSLAFGIAYYAIWDYVKMDKTPYDMKGVAMYTIPIAVSTICFTFITNIDTFLVRGLMLDYDAGIYSSASMLGKIVLWLPGAITTVTFPHFSEKRVDETRELMRKSIGIVLATVLAVWIGFLLFPDVVMSVAYSAAYSDASACLPVVILAFALFGLASVFMKYGMATSDFAYAIIIALFTIIGVLLVVVNHGTPLDVGYDMLFTSGGICLVSYAYTEARWWTMARKEGRVAGP
jgi:O-antigen/teichoic acid export membrane protein